MKGCLKAGARSFLAVATGAVLFLAVAVIRVTPVEAVQLQGQVLTYSDFNSIRHITSSMSHVYFATTGGIIRFNKLERRWETPMTGSIGLDHEDVSRLWVDAVDSKLFAQTSLGIHEYDLLFESWFLINELPVVNNDSRHIQPPVIMYPPPGYNYDGETGRLIDFWGRSFLINDIIDDGSGELWIGTWGYGILTSETASKYLELLPYGLLQDRVNALYRDNNDLWLSGAVLNEYRTGLTIFDMKREQFEYIETGLDLTLPAVDVNCLDGDESSVYIGTPRGLLILDRATRQVVTQISERHGLSDDNVLSLLVLGDSVFAGTPDGLNLVRIENDSTQVVRPSQFRSAIIYDIEAVNSSVWIASSAGAYRIKLPSGKLQRFQDPDLVLFGDVYDVERYENFLWLLSDDGLVRLDMEAAESTPFRDVMRRSTPYCLAVNDTIAAVGTDKGLTILFHANRHPFSRDFTTDDGLPSNLVFVLLLDGDYLWLGTDRGLTRFLWNNPARID